MSFSKRPTEDLVESEADFRRARPEAAEEPPWERHPKGEKPTRGINVRLPERTLALARFVADSESRSIQAMLQRLLGEELEKRARKAWKAR